MKRIYFQRLRGEEGETHNERQTSSYRYFERKGTTQNNMKVLLQVLML